MSLYVIGDLHLTFSDPSKTMEVFPGWENYQERIEKNWLETVKPEDTVVIAGDLSWGMSLQQAEPDFRFINGLPGRKLILKGNHDYWWVTKKKMETFFAENGFDTLNGTDGSRDVQDEKVLKREVQRLETSIKSAVEAGLEPLVFMHYPPIFASNFNYDILEILYRYNIKECYYGHIHGRSAHELCVKNTYDGVNFHLISGDYIHFMPEKVL